MHVLNPHHPCVVEYAADCGANPRNDQTKKMEMTQPIVLVPYLPAMFVENHHVHQRAQSGYILLEMKKKHRFSGQSGLVVVRVKNSTMLKAAGTTAFYRVGKALLVIPSTPKKVLGQTTESPIRLDSFE